MYGIGQNRTHTEHGRKGISPGTQMRHRTQIFKGVLLFLYGKIRLAGTVNNDIYRPDLQGLARVGRKHHVSLHNQTGRNVLLFHSIKILKTAVKYHLNIFLAGTVVQLNKAEIPGGPYRTNPAGHSHTPRLHSAIDIPYKIRFHINTSFCICIRYYTPKTQDLSNH